MEEEGKKAKQDVERSIYECPDRESKRGMRCPLGNVQLTMQRSITHRRGKGKASNLEMSHQELSFKIPDPPASSQALFFLPGTRQNTFEAFELVGEE